jgi:uncharacterized protein (DUF2062 family)
MAKKFFRKYLPDPDHVKRHRALAVFGRALHAPNLWHLNRHSVGRAFAVGAFWAVIPLPFQMVPAALCALVCRANLALTVFLVCLTNPLTIGPVYYGTYRLGRLVMGINPNDAPLELTMSSIGGHLGRIWQPLYVGSIVTGALLSGASYLIVRSAWRWNVGRRWRRRSSQILPGVERVKHRIIESLENAPPPMTR